MQDYLETKRVAFPRFYFVAPADLLDILSKGSNPQLILRHLPKCFDNVHNLEFRKDERGEPSKIALGMYSGEQPTPLRNFDNQGLAVFSFYLRSLLVHT